MMNAKEEISKFFLNLLGRNQHFGEAKKATNEEVNFKVEWYETYILLLQKNIKAIDNVILMRNSMIKNEKGVTELTLTAEYEVAQLELQKIDLEKELIAKQYYCDNYKFRIAEQMKINQSLTIEADANFDKLIASAYQLLQYKKEKLDQKEVVRLTGMIYQKESKPLEVAERTKLYSEMTDLLKTIVARIEGEELVKNKPLMQKVDLSK